MSLVPLPLGNDIHGLIPSPITKIFVTLGQLLGGDTRRSPSANLPSSECPVQRVLDVHDIKSSNVLLPVHDDTRSAHVTPTGDHDNVACVELDVIGDFALLQIKLDSVVDRDQGVGIANRSAIVGDDMRDTFGTDSHPADLQELVRGFLRRDAVDCKPALDVVEKAEVLARFLNRNDIYIERL